jgi:hypothetical protein
MDSKKNKYQPETDFEKKEFSKLINNIRQSDEEKVSDEFEKNFFTELHKVKPVMPLGLRIKTKINFYFEQRRIKLFAVAVTAVAFFLVVAILSIKEHPQIGKNSISRKDSSQIEPEKNQMNIQEQKNIATQDEKQLKAQTGKKTETAYWKGIMRDLNQKYGFSLSDKTNSSELLREITEGELFKKNIERKNILKRDDTLKILIQLLRKIKE